MRRDKGTGGLISESMDNWVQSRVLQGQAREPFYTPLSYVPNWTRHSTLKASFWVKALMKNKEAKDNEGRSWGLSSLSNTHNNKCKINPPNPPRDHKLTNLHCTSHNSLTAILNIVRCKHRFAPILPFSYPVIWIIVCYTNHHLGTKSDPPE